MSGRMLNEVSSGILTPTIKNLGYFPAVVVGLSIENYSILIILLVVDIITGIWRSAVLHTGDSITSRKAINGIMSKFLFLLIPVTLAVMGKGLGLDLVGLARMALGLLMFFTGYSIISNIHSIHTGKRTKEFDVVRIILMQLENFLGRLEGGDRGKK